ncbi:MAG: hypothetical protein WCF95_01785 [bacterium]
MISAISNNNIQAQNKPAFGATFLKYKSSLVGKEIKSQPLEDMLELNIMNNLLERVSKNDFEFKGKILENSESEHSLPIFKSWGGDTVIIQPDLEVIGSPTPKIEVLNKERTELLEIFSGNNSNSNIEAAPNLEQMQLFDKLVEAFKAIIPKK